MKSEIDETHTISVNNIGIATEIIIWHGTNQNCLNNETGVQICGDSGTVRIQQVVPEALDILCLNHDGAQFG
jgi:hypothetical protein